MAHISDLPLRRTRGFTILILLAVTLALSACNKNKDRVAFDGKFFKTKAKSASDDRQSFTVKVPRINQGLTPALEAGRYEGTRYCVENFGTSDIEWINGPDADDSALNISGTTLTLSGRCSTW